jgi:hypothetical protein
MSPMAQLYLRNAKKVECASRMVKKLEWSSDLCFVAARVAKGVFSCDCLMQRGLRGPVAALELFA